MSLYYVVLAVGQWSTLRLYMYQLCVLRYAPQETYVGK